MPLKDPRSPWLWRPITRGTGLACVLVAATLASGGQASASGTQSFTAGVATSSQTIKLPDGRMRTTIAAVASGPSQADNLAAPLAPIAFAAGKASEGSQLACTLDEQTPTISSCAGKTIETGWKETGAGRGYGVHALVNFPLPAVGHNVLVLNAKLEVYEKSATVSKAVSMNVDQVITPWAAGATWQTTNGTTAWKKPGGDAIEEGALLATSAGEAKGWKTWYPTKMVQQWIDGPHAPKEEGAENFGFLLKDAEEYEVSNIVTFEGPTAAKHPTLTIEWTPRGVGHFPNATLLPIASTSTTSASVDVASGDLILTSNDLKINSEGSPFVVARTFNSLEPGELGFGRGWTEDNDSRLRVEEGGSLEYTDSTGASYEFVRGTGGGYTGPSNLAAVVCSPELGGKDQNGYFCPSTYPAGVTYEVIYTKTEAAVAFGGKEGTIYPVAIKPNSSSEEEQAHYTKGYTLPTSWTDTAGLPVEYKESKTEGYEKVTFPDEGEAISYTERADASGAYKLSEFVGEAGEKATYEYGTGAAEALVTTVTEPSGERLIFTYEGGKLATSEVIPPKLTSGGLTHYKYYVEGSAPTPCTVYQAATEVRLPDKERIIFCVNSLDEVERVAHEARLGLGPATTMSYSAYNAETPVLVNVVNGNAVLTTEELYFGNGSNVFTARTFNTLATTPGALGAGWRENWGPDVELTFETNGEVIFTDPSGYREAFIPQQGGGYKSEDEAFGELSKTGANWLLVTAAGDVYEFGAHGELVTYEDAGTPGRESISYTTVAGQLELNTIVAPNGEKFTAHYNEGGDVKELVAGNGEKVTYEYTTGWEPSVHLLTKAYASGSEATVTATYAPQTFALTEVVASTGETQKLAYDAYGRVTEITETHKSEAPQVTKYSYEAPSSSECTTEDVGQTTVSNGEPEENEVYCYNSEGRVTNPHEKD
jgi:YD repeat-containing protein